MSRPVPFYPVLTVRGLAGPERGLPAPLDRRDAVLLGYARAGLRRIAAALGGPGNVLIPDFICASAVEPFASNGLDVRHYAIGPGLQPDPGEIERAIDPATRAVMLVSFFGLPQPFADVMPICRERGVILIDDAAHSLLSEQDGRPHGTLGDVGVVGVRKVLAVPDGAALVGGEELGVDRSQPSGTGSVRAYLARSVARTVDAATRADLLGRRARGRSGALPEGGSPAVPEDRGMTSLTRRVLGRIRAEDERARRRRVFAAWAELVDGAGAAPLLDSELPAGTSPSAYPLRIADEERFARRMRELRVEWIRWPDMPDRSREFPRGVALLPTHAAPTPT